MSVLVIKQAFSWVMFVNHYFINDHGLLWHVLCSTFMKKHDYFILISSIGLFYLFIFSILYGLLKAATYIKLQAVSFLFCFFPKPQLFIQHNQNLSRIFKMFFGHFFCLWVYRIQLSRECNKVSFPFEI